jgi:ATP-dependent RNA helicase DDX5/DBP2
MVTRVGLTHACLAPLRVNTPRTQPRYGPTVLVLAPTRELAMQIKTEADKFGRTSGVRNT